MDKCYRATEKELQLRLQESRKASRRKGHLNSGNREKTSLLGRKIKCKGRRGRRNKGRKVNRGWVMEGPVYNAKKSGLP